jgi:D-glycerate 3-kinase
MAAAGRPGMSDEQVADFVSRYMPAYRAYLPPLYEAARGGGVGGKPTLMVDVNASRNPVRPKFSATKYM